MVYLDWASTAPPDTDPEAGAPIEPQGFGNPSSAHPEGRRAREALETARSTLAGLLGCGPGELVYTSGGTESNWIVLSSLLDRTGRKARVISSGVEHASVHDNLAVLERFGLEVVLVPTREDGIVDAGRILDAVDAQTVMVVLMYVNNVTGAIQPVAEVASALADRRRAGGRRVHLHTDAVQALGKVPLDLGALGADSASLSAHKIGGPRGIGALYLRDGATLTPLARGGDQERGLRPGTENTAGAAAFARAARRRLGDLERVLARARELDTLLGSLLESLPGCRLLPPGRGALPSDRYTPCIRSAAFPPIPSEVLVRALGEEGFCVSAGSACASAHREKRERVYRNMGLPPAVTGSAIRISTGPTTRVEEIRGLVDALARLTPRLARVAAP